MQKCQQQFSIGYFVIALALLFAVQTFFASPHVETITYSQFKALAKKGLVSYVVIGEQNNSRRDQTRRAKGTFIRRSFEGFE